MVHITNTANNLGHFIVRDEQGSYDNEYTDAIIEAERSVELRRAAQTAISATLRRTGLLTRRAAYAVLCAVDDYIASAG